MVSDEELARRVAQTEEAKQAGVAGGQSVTDELDEYRSTAGEIHDELARRIEDVDEDTVDQAAFDSVVERLDELEAKLEALASRVQD